MKRKNVETTINQHLDKDESLLWSGEPPTGIKFRTMDIVMIPFSVLWCGFAIFWVVMASSAGLFALFGVPFVCVGLFFVFGRFIVDAKNRQNTYYGITATRVIIISGLLKKSIRSINIPTISDLEMSEEKNGIGTITLGPKNTTYNPWGNGINWPGVETTPTLESIPAVRSVYKMIANLQRQDRPLISGNL